MLRISSEQGSNSRKDIVLIIFLINYISNSSKTLRHVHTIVTEQSQISDMVPPTWWTGLNGLGGRAPNLKHRRI